ncbi:hypothetical protein KC359_g148 [Hortaea werneckii]|nr:hypothetical protein KC359_g148 [Hortaea werneckii]
MSHIGRSAISPGLVVESCAITQGVDFGRLLQQLPPATMIGLAATGKREDPLLSGPTAAETPPNNSVAAGFKTLVIGSIIIDRVEDIGCCNRGQCISPARVEMNGCRGGESRNSTETRWALMRVAAFDGHRPVLLLRQSKQSPGGISRDTIYLRAELSLDGGQQSRERLERLSPPGSGGERAWLSRCCWEARARNRREPMRIAGDVSSSLHWDPNRGKRGQWTTRPKLPVCWVHSSP